MVRKFNPMTYCLVRHPCGWPSVRQFIAPCLSDAVHLSSASSHNYSTLFVPRYPIPLRPSSQNLRPLVMSFLRQARSITYHHQDSLPKLPVPDIESTAAKYFRSILPIVSPQDARSPTASDLHPTPAYEHTKACVHDFLNSPLVKELQLRLKHRAEQEGRDNWLSEWWDDLAYMGYRDPLIPFSSYYIAHKPDPYRKNGARRAAGLIRALLEFRDLVELERLEPEQGRSGPLCMNSYRWLFNSCRYPVKPSAKPPGITCLQVTGLDDNLIVTGGMDKIVQVYDRSSEKVIATLKGSTKKINSIAVVGGRQATSKELPKMIIAAYDKHLRFWVPSEKKVGYVAGGTIVQSDEVVGIDLHPSETLLLSGSRDGSWSLHDLTPASGTPSTILTVALQDVPADSSLSSVKWHPDGVILAVGLSNSTLKVFDVKTASCVANFDGHSSVGGGPIKSMCFSENGYSLATTAQNSAAVKLWDLRKLTNYHTITLPEGYQPTMVAWDYSAQFIGVVGNDLRVWQSKTWEELLVYDGNTAELTGLNFVRAGGEIVVGGMDRTVTILSAPVAKNDSVQS